MSGLLPDREANADDVQATTEDAGTRGSQALRVWLDSSRIGKAETYGVNTESAV